MMGHSSFPSWIPKPPDVVGVRRFAILAVVAGLACAPAALADTTQSTNWAGYAAHGGSYRAVQGSWIQPNVSCTRGVQTYSSYWVGIGGYSQTSQALEQIGTEVDCSADGSASSTAWYELVPNPSVTVGLAVRPGDAMQAAVSVSGDSVTMSLADATRKQVYRKSFHDSNLDLTSAEWIVEAPSECVSANSCQTLPLANFGSATFTSAAAQSSGGHAGAISDPAWQTTRINLRPDSRRFVVNTSAGPALGLATPSSLASNGTTFKVAYSQILVPGGVGFPARDTSLRAGHVVHPGR
jgi:hypothetical protein